MAKHRWLLAWGLGSIAAGAASLLVPLYIVQLGATPFQLGLLGAVTAFVGAPGALFWGRLADRTARPRVLVLFSLVGVAALLAAAPLLTSIPVLIAVNAALWLVFAAAGPVLTLLVVADVPESAWNREIALLNTYQGYGWAGGLLLGIVWSATAGRVLAPNLAQQGLFVAASAAAALAAVLMVRWMPSPSASRLADVDPERVARLLSAGRRGVRGATFLFNPTRLYWSTRTVRPRALADRFTPTLATYFLAVVLFFTGFAAFFAPLPLYLTDAGFTAEAVFGLYLVSSLGSAVFYSGAGRLSGRYDLRGLQAGSLGVRSVAMPLVVVAGGVAGELAGTLAVGALFAIIGLSWAVIAVTAGTIVTRVAPAAVRGEALGVYAALSTLATGIGSVLGGTLADVAGFGVAFLGAGAAVLAGALLVGSLRGLSPDGALGRATVPRPSDHE
ncbi:MFS transporter [Halomicroarcula sp. GCM10025817]|uniref:MFS transporter n=1 Tax=Haloarcula TaxID=2237 RepID=UPI0023E7716E|nr:MFS transporter [Halomicroarcula sp. SYNS111]